MNKMSAQNQEHSPNNGTDQKHKNNKPTWSEWAKNQYDAQYENWVPWLEDLYLRYFTKDNKASYATKDTLSKTKITNIEQVNTLQDGVHNLVAGQVGQGGLAQPVGDLFSKEGVNRMERKGKDERGGYLPDTSVDSVRNVGGLLGGK
ncbi:hypothetical protein SMACR_08664 [Sordaria macrospora]|uniref:WGS project CABT00000000 data, contig 2.61 n=2 Tax=Sordaria macrospora TaxID=5147 RepID=F7WAI5_SORMK|nr:uncharacterized protein SMAC_08664 [Sordaria macrospora k-hell]KAA8629694.1 hypothetical protein SMACR_08664 [Sordaria macrospora]WPJ65238.1 hypothetical protein SMAC4_08664 [Sordaria macrospora]CCC05350.1 unnamed protein product [Sordaria macrospora k-hell]